MQFAQRRFGLIYFCLFLGVSAPAHAGMLCSWLGIGCDPVATMGRSADGDAPAPTQIDQNNPPQVFSFTVSGKFDEWTDIAPETFVCDTREREDRACEWRGHIPEIKRLITVHFKPFAHDLGMYNIKGWVESNIAQDGNFRVKMGIDDAPEFQEAPGVLISVRKGVSLTHLAQFTLKAQIFEAGSYKVNLRKEPYGAVTLKFKEVLK